MLTNYVKAIRYLQGIEKNGEPFTIRDWMRGVREDRNGWLFISPTLTPMLPEAGLDVAVNCYPRPAGDGENRNRRVDFRRRAPHAAQAAGLGRNP